MQPLSPQISMNALFANQNHRSMRVHGLMNGKPLHILIDSGSTHNFLNTVVANKLRCFLSTIDPQSVVVVDGNHIVCTQMSKEFQCSLLCKKFVTDALLIFLGNCNVVLGVQWLSTLGLISQDFKNLVMEFVMEGRKFTLQAIPPNKLNIVLEGELSSKLLATTTHVCLLQV